MPLMDEFREEREAIKHGTREQKYQYFKDYYRTPLIIAVLAITFIGILVFQFVTRKDLAFYGMFLNCSPYQENEWFLNEFTEQAGISLDEYDVTMDTAVYFKLNSVDEDTQVTVQKIDTYTGAGHVDVMLGGGEEFAHFANSIMFKDIREVLTEEQIEKYEPYFYYIDEAFLEEINKVATIGDDTTTLDIPDPRDPDSMERPKPVAIFVESSEKLNEAYYFKNAEDGIAVGVFANTSHPESVQTFIDYLMAE